MAGKIIISNPSGGTPGGNDKELQYNNAGAFGGCAQLFWDNANDRLGLGDSTPAKQLSITKCMEMLVCSGSGVGVIYKGANRFLHDFKHATADGNNLFIGANCGNFTMTPGGGAADLASNNVGLGVDALKALTDGKDNMAIGYRALTAATGGSRNVAIGKESLDDITGGWYNIGIGCQSLFHDVTGDSNIAIGYGAGRGTDTQSFSDNILIGYKAGYILGTTGDRNICIGSLAGDNITSGHTNITVGYNLDALAAAGNYQLNIASLIFGDIGATKKLGVNTSTMNETLNVGGAIRLGTSALTNNGAIRWNGTDFEGYMTGWKSLTILKGLNEIFTTKGDVLVRGAADPERLAGGGLGSWFTGMGAGEIPVWYTPCTTVGDMVYHTAAGYLQRLAAGAAGTVLTANGAAALPTWQSSGSTKEFFVPTTYTLNGAMGIEDTYACAKLTDLGHDAYITFRVPHDYSSITNATIVVIPECTQANCNWDTYSSYAQTGEDSVIHNQSNVASTYNVTWGVVFEVDISGILTSLAANDNVGIKIYLSNAGHDLNVLGVRFKYA